MNHSIWLYIAVMAAVCYAIRVLPLTLLRRRIENRFLRSFLYYVPYVTLSVMTFPSIVEATRTPIAGGAALLLGVLLAWMGAGLFPVAVSCCATVFVLEWFLVAV
ncbi:MAG: AzlD domain-containing protein [Oscillibacter sp.]|nr:AzlD domain-containing protein [Oscillibacter sp.]